MGVGTAECAGTLTYQYPHPFGLNNSPSLWVCPWYSHDRLLSVREKHCHNSYCYSLLFNFYIFAYCSYHTFNILCPFLKQYCNWNCEWTRNAFQWSLCMKSSYQPTYSPLYTFKAVYFFHVYYSNNKLEMFSVIYELLWMYFSIWIWEWHYHTQEARAYHKLLLAGCVVECLQWQIHQDWNTSTNHPHCYCTALWEMHHSCIVVCNRVEGLSGWGCHHWPSAANRHNCTCSDTHQDPCYQFDSGELCTNAL